jgi:transcriptional antiterminator RfaH
MAYWACAQTAPRRESVARHFLELSDFEVYLPLVRERRTVRASRAEVVRPLFPNYLFVRIALQWSRARWAIGVTRFILDGERPAVVSDQIIDGLRQRERDGIVHLPRQLKHRRGDKLRITAGPFRGHLALYEGMTARERILVLLTLFGSLHKVELPQDAVEAC